MDSGVVRQAHSEVFRVRSNGQRTLGLGDLHDARVVDRPPNRRGHAIDMIATEIEQVAVSFGQQIADQDPALGISERDGGYGLGVTSHLGAGSHRASLDDNSVISKHLAQGSGPKDLERWADRVGPRLHTDVPRSGAPVSHRVATGYASNLTLRKPAEAMVLREKE